MLGSLPSGLNFQLIIILESWLKVLFWLIFLVVLFEQNLCPWRKTKLNISMTEVSASFLSLVFSTHCTFYFLFTWKKNTARIFWVSTQQSLLSAQYICALTMRLYMWPHLFDGSYPVRRYHIQARVCRRRQWANARIHICAVALPSLTFWRTPL